MPLLTLFLFSTFPKLNLCLKFLTVLFISPIHLVIKAYTSRPILHFIVFCRYFAFYILRLVATLCQTSLQISFFL